MFVCSFQGAEICVGALLLFRAVSSQVPSAAQVLTIVFGMGTGVSPARISTNMIDIALSPWTGSGRIHAGRCLDMRDADRQ